MLLKDVIKLSKGDYMKKAHIYKSVFIIFYTVAVFCAGIVSDKYLFSFLYRTFHKPVVSVLMSTFNRAQALPSAIESILEQTFTDLEFIIIDDGSTDNTWNIIQSYAKKDPRIKALRNKRNKGLIYSLNRGLDVARGKYVARMDDDDKSVPFRLERQVWAMDENPDIIVLGSGIFDTNGTPKHLYSYPLINNPDEVELDTYISSPLAHPTIVIRRDFLEKNHIRYNPKYLYAEDTGLYKDILEKGGKISSLDEGLLHFGYVKNVIKPEKYSYIQSETFKQVQKEKLAPFFNAPYEILGFFNSNNDKCTILTNMIPKNKKLKIVNQELLEKRQKAICKKENLVTDSIEAIHTWWTDYIHVDEKDKTFFRMSAPSESGKIINEDENTVTVKWDNYGTEVFIKENNGKTWRLKEKTK